MKLPNPRNASARRLVLLAAVGLTLLTVAVWRWDAAATWQADGARGRAADHLERVAAALGVDARDGDLAVLGRQDLAAARQPGPEPSFQRIVEWVSDGEQTIIEAIFGGDGSLWALELRGPSSTATDLEEAEARIAARRLAEETLTALMILSPDEIAALPAPEVEERGPESWRLRWQRPAEGIEGSNEVVEVSVRAGRVTEVRREVPGASADQATDRENFVRFLIFLVALAALFYAIQSRRFYHPHRNGLALAKWVAALAALGVLLTFEQRSFGSGAVGTFIGSLFDPILLRAGAAWLFFSAGCAAARQAVPEKFLELETLLAGDFRREPIGRTVALALALGPWLALVLYLVGGLGLGRGLILAGGNPEAAASPWPWAVALCPQGGLAALAVFGMLAPLLHRFLPGRWAPRVVTVSLGAIFLAADLPAEGSARSLFLLALVAAVFLEQVYRRRGLLAVLVMAYASGAALRGLALLIQPGLSLKLSGGVAVLSLLAACGSLAVVAGRWRGDLLAVEGLRLTPRHRSRRERIRAQLEVAREAQFRMLPAAPPAVEGWSLAASCFPAREVGGDLYDFIPLGERWGIAQGDVSGKGMVASLYMTLTKGLMLAAMEHLEAPRDVLSVVNDGLYRESDRDIFVTLWYGLLDPRDGRLIHARAGHNSVFWRRPGRGLTTALQPKGLAAGAVKTATFDRVMEDEEILMEPGDALFIYTDGISEAMDLERNEYGLERLEAAVGETDGMAAQEAMEHVLADVRAFCGPAPAHDDLTLIVIRFEGLPAAG